ncbi:MAG TPA: isoprenylcysteine carboxylmethyltransferase family protein [Ensifer sp.]|jgi:protein-S-isoprenylcysteine O-methyltransferase Ste14|uniref:methyltransferase family protein n=1 Tax=Ensifer sp. TaxID=1872086 RepID=UPI002E15700C|nr:isoprenylcysteine carboxylmethyltransferase family protein [Ensifer sp.]
MIDTNGHAEDRSGAVVRPPIVWLAAVGGGLLLDGAHPLPFLPGIGAGRLAGVAVFFAAVALLIWAATTFRRAGTEVQTTRPTTAIVEAGPYRFTRNPIYVAMFLGLVGLALAFDSFWLLILLVPFYLVIRHGVVAREETYLERKFGEGYLAYKARVRRWL